MRKQRLGEIKWHAQSKNACKVTEFEFKRSVWLFTTCWLKTNRQNFTDKTHCQMFLKDTTLFSSLFTFLPQWKHFILIFLKGQKTLLLVYMKTFFIFKYVLFLQNQSTFIVENLKIQTGKNKIIVFLLLRDYHCWTVRVHLTGSFSGRMYDHK